MGGESTPGGAATPVRFSIKTAHSLCLWLTSVPHRHGACLAMGDPCAMPCTVCGTTGLPVLTASETSCWWATPGSICAGRGVGAREMEQMLPAYATLWSSPSATLSLVADLCVWFRQLRDRHGHRAGAQRARGACL